ncbi:MAG: hypothetical protein K0R57_5445 [Paenibacillaceae bacterium]|jgi:two-component system sensor histidine kinase ComP|nr:hypothetical protein [Paenibacillaceae bacterium]
MKKTLLLRILVVCFIFYQIWAFVLMARYPIIGINVGENADGKWHIISMDIANISAEADLKIGDQILEINGDSPDHYWAVQKWKTAEQADTISVIKDGSRENIQIDKIPSFCSYDITSLLAESLSLLIAVLLYRNSGKSHSSLWLSAVFCNIAFIFLMLVTSVRGDLTGRFFISVFMLILPAIFFQFLYVFLNEKGSVMMPVTLLKCYCLIGTVAVLLQLSYFRQETNSYYINQIVRLTGLGVTISGILLDFIILLHFYYKYRKENNVTASIIRTVFWALFFSVAPIVFLSFVPRIIFGHEWLASLHMSWFIFLFPLTFVYLLVTRRLYDVDVIMRRILFSIAIAAVPSLIITAILAYIYPHEISFERLALSLMLVLSVLTLVLYALENITTKIMPIMFPRKYQLQAALKKLSTNMGSISSFQEMKDIILADLVQTLEVTGGAIVFWYEDAPEMILEGDIARQDVEELIHSGSWKDCTDYTCFEVSRQEEYTSYLIMGKKRSGTVLGLEETQWLGLIIHYLSVSLENVHLIRKLNRKLQQMASLLPNEEAAMDISWFRKVMFELQEKERLRMASDLHDTTMQDLFFLKGKLRTLLDRYTYTKEDNTTLSGLMDYIDIINMNLRQSCFELHPYLLKEIGLVATLHKLIHSEQAVCPFEIELFTSEVAQIEGQDMELKRHLFRMVQELLNNAKKHSEARQVRLSIYMHRDKLCFQYEDNGIGFDPSRQAVRGEVRASGMGLEQLKSRILSLGGQYELDTGIGQGMKLSAHLPKWPKGSSPVSF